MVGRRDKGHNYTMKLYEILKQSCILAEEISSARTAPALAYADKRRRELLEALQSLPRASSARAALTLAFVLGEYARDIEARRREI